MRRGAGRAAAVLAVLLLAAAGAAGCTASSAAPAPSSTGVGGHLVWWDVGSRTGTAAADRAIAENFERANPGTTIEVQVLSSDDAWAKFDTAAQASAGAPDVITLDGRWIPDFASRGYLARLDNTEAVDGAEDVLPSLLPTEKYDGRVYAAARSADGLALLYNPRLLRIADVAVPHTWADVSAMRLKLTAHDVQTLYSAASAEWLLPWIYGEGGALLDPEAKTIEVSQPAAVAGLSRRLELVATGVAVDDSTPGSADAMRTAFRQGRVAMILDEAASLPLLTGGAAFATASEIGIVPVPSGSVRSSSPVTTSSYGVWAGSHNLATAYRFVAYAQSAGVQALLAERLGLLPTRAAAYQLDVVRSDPTVSAFQQVLKNGTPLPQVPQQSALLGPLDDAFRTALTGGGSAQAVLDGVAQSYLRILSGYTIGPAAS